jgi:HEAT repeat protein
VVIERSATRRTADLVRDLDGDDPVKREAAVARLVIAGARAIDPLLRALDSASPDGQVAMLTALAGLAEPRALEPAITQLRSSHLAVAEAAVAAVRPHLAAADAQVAARATAALVAICVDRRREDALRLAALEALSEVGDAVLHPLWDRLRADSSERVRRAAQSQTSDEAVGAEASAARLEAAATRPGDDPGALTQWIRDGAAHVSLATLHELVLAMRERERSAPTARRRAWTMAIGAAHLALAQRGSRLALFDLREALDQLPPDRLHDYVSAAGDVGDASCLEPLASAWTRSPDEAVRGAIESAVAKIVEREGITRRHAVWKKLTSRFKQAADRMWSVASVRRG